jgi:chromosome segregation ATPase
LRSGPGYGSVSVEGKANSGQELTTELEKTKKETYSQLAAAKEAHQRQFEAITNEATKKLSESEKRVADLTEHLKSISAQGTRLRKGMLTQSKLTENQSQLEAIQNELAKVKEATEEVKAKAARVRRKQLIRP